jgi:hypothetical protein
MRPHATSNRIRRHTANPAPEVPLGGRAQIAPAPPPIPNPPPRPLGDLSRASAEAIVGLVAERFADINRNTLADYKHGMRRLLALLADQPGPTWQQRWEAAGLNQPGQTVADLAGDDPKWRSRLIRAAGIAFCTRLIRPSTAALQATNPPQYTDRFLQAARDPLLEEFRTRLRAHPVSAEARRNALSQLCRALTVFGIDLADLTPGGLLQWANDHPGSGIAVAWPLLHDMGRIPAWAPRTLQDARIRGRYSIEELVDRQRLRNHAVRDLLVDYIRRRSPELDYATMENLVRSLAGHFWKLVEVRHEAPSHRAG